MAPSRDRVAFASLLVGTARTLARALDFVGLLVVAAVVSPESFGIVSIALTTHMICQSLTLVNVWEPLIQRREKPEQAHYDTAFTICLLRGLAVTGLIAATAWPLGAAYDSDLLGHLVLLLALGPALEAVRSPKSVDALRRVRFASSLAVELIAALVGFGAVLAALRLVDPAYALPIGVLARSAAVSITSFLVFPYAPGLSLARASEILGFSIWASLATSVATLSNLDRYAVAALIGAGAYGVYAIGMTIATQVSFAIAAACATPLFAGFSRVRGDTARLREAALLGQQSIVVILLPAGVGLALIAEDLVAVIFGPEWSGAALAIQIMAPVFAFEMIFAVTNALLLAGGAPKRLLHRNLLAVAVELLLVVVGAAVGGLFGAIIGKACGSAFKIALNMALVADATGCSIVQQLANLRRCIFAVLVMTGALLVADISLLSQEAQLAIEIALGAIIYVAAVALTWRAAGRPHGAEKIALGLVQRRSRLTVEDRRASD